MTITIPELSLVVLIGASGSGKSTFARKHFKPTEVLSSDYCRGLVSDDENSMEATGDAFDVLHYIARKRHVAGKLKLIAQLRRFLSGRSLPFKRTSTSTGDVKRMSGDLRSFDL